MNSNYIVKVQFEDSLRRLTLGKGELDFSKLEVRTRDLFQIEQTAPLALTYTDKDGDTVTMADDQDLKDALVLQKINPLRLNVVMSGTKGIPAAEKENAAPAAEAKVEKTEKPASTESAAPVDQVVVPANAGFGPERPIHFGVKCDVCGIMPMKGIRYKSNKEMNYDLCEACFQKSGAPVDDYLKMDRSFDRQRFPFRMGGRGGRGRGRMSSPQRPIPPLGNCCGVGLPPQSGSETQPEAQKEVNDATTTQKNQEAVPAKPDSPSEPAAADAAAAPAVASDQPGQDRAVMGERMMRLTAPCTLAGTGLFGQYMWNLGLKKPISESNAKAPEAEAKNVPAPEGKVASTEEDVTTKEGKLSKLAAMGFTDERVNIEVLEKNKFDLRKSLDDLCAAEEWDQPLAELQEMGFSDASINRSLMFKYDGNVKKVVRELVQLSKVQSNLGKGVKQG